MSASDTRRSTDSGLPPGVVHARVRLADGTEWGIAGSDTQAAHIVRALAEAMRLGPVQNAKQHLLVQVNQGPSAQPRLQRQPGGSFLCRLGSASDREMMAVQLMRLSRAFVSLVEEGGGTLLHGALAALNGMGVLLAGPSGAGKSTASRRLPPPWESLSDDATLVVRDGQGKHWAHPWPTWSAFAFGGPGGAWDVQRTVPLSAIFFLQPARTDRVEALGKAESVGLLLASAEQTSHALTHDVEPVTRRALRSRRLDTLCTLAQAIPVYRLYWALTGSFWHEIEQANGVKSSCR